MNHDTVYTKSAIVIATTVANIGQARYDTLLLTKTVTKGRNLNSMSIGMK